MPSLRYALPTLFLLLAACAGPDIPEPVAGLPRSHPSPLQCVPYARQVSGIRIFGDAWTWWDASRDRYERGQEPVPGAALVFRKTRTMVHGHVAVVTRVLGRREILVTHANWANGTANRGEVTEDVRVRDASPLNDWTAVRVWNEPSASFGAIYQAYGFVYPAPGTV